MIIDRRMITQVLGDTKKEALALLSLGLENGLELLGALLINTLAVIGMGAIGLTAFISFLLGEVELGDLIG